MSTHRTPPAATPGWAPPLLLALAVGLAACGSAGSREWVKPGASEAQMAQDHEDCQLRGQSVAMSEAARQRQLSPSSTITTTGSGTVSTSPSSSVQSLSYLRQSEVFEQCMRGRGYRLQ